MNALPRPEELIGSFRRFGYNGPLYEVFAVSAPTPDGAARLRVRLPETGEELDVPYVQVMQDPVEDD